MAARRVRAVRADPGATSDRRASERDGATVDPWNNTRKLATLRAISGVRLSKGPAGATRAALVDTNPSGPQPGGGFAEKAPSTGPRSRGLRLRRSDGVEPRRAKSLAYELSRHCGSLEVLQFLYREGAATASLMNQALTPTHTSLESSRRWLVELGLVGCQDEAAFPFRKTYVLTDRGRALVESPPISWPQIFSTQTAR